MTTPPRRHPWDWADALRVEVVREILHHDAILTPEELREKLVEQKGLCYITGSQLVLPSLKQGTWITAFDIARRADPAAYYCFSSMPALARLDRHGNWLYGNTVIVTRGIHRAIEMYGDVNTAIALFKQFRSLKNEPTT